MFYCTGYANFVAGTFISIKRLEYRLNKLDRDRLETYADI